MNSGTDPQSPQTTAPEAKPRHRWRQRLLIASAVLIVVIAGLWIWNRNATVVEKASPDYLDFGAVARHSVVEFNVRFLAFEPNRPFDKGFDYVLRAAPRRWRSAIYKWHPKRARSKAPTVDLTRLEPALAFPEFVRVESVTPEQRANWYNNHPFFVVHMRLDTSRIGEHSGTAKMTMDKRQSELPIRFAVRPNPMLPKLLIAQTPYDSDATSRGSDFKALGKIVSSLNVQVDYREKLPLSLEGYQTVLLADDALMMLTHPQRNAVTNFVKRGGRLILACNAFMPRTVAKANEILADHGLSVQYRDYSKEVAATNFTSDRLTQNIRQLRFFRPSLIQVTDPSKGKIVAWDPTRSGGFVAVSRAAGRGEVIVLGVSLWWHWIGQFPGTHNADMLQRILAPP